MPIDSSSCSAASYPFDWALARTLARIVSVLSPLLTRTAKAWRRSRLMFCGKAMPRKRHWARSRRSRHYSVVAEPVLRCSSRSTASLRNSSSCFGSSLAPSARKVVCFAGLLGGGGGKYPSLAFTDGAPVINSATAMQPAFTCLHWTLPSISTVAGPKIPRLPLSKSHPRSP